jgi:hypothetical protein
MTAAALYGVLTLIYVFFLILLGVLILPIAVRTEILYDLGLALLGLVTSLLLYTQSIALLTATERLVEIMNKVT